MSLDTYFGLHPRKLQPVPVFDAAYGGKVFILDESVHPTGTFKDRRTAGVVRKILEGNIGGNVVLGTITSGNSGNSAEYWVTQGNDYARRYNSETQFWSISIVDQDNVPTYLGKKDHSIILPIDLNQYVSTQDFRQRIEAHARENGIDNPTVLLLEFDVPSTPADQRVRLPIYGVFNEYYGRMVDEIVSNLNSEITIFCPVGNGELFHALASRALIYNNAKINVIGVTVEANALGQRVIETIGESIFGTVRGFKFEGAATFDEIEDCYQRYSGRHYKGSSEDLFERRLYSKIGFLSSRTRVLAKLGKRLPDGLTNSIADKLVCSHTPYEHLFFEEASTFDIPTFIVVENGDITREQALWEEQFSCEPSACASGAGARVVKEAREQWKDKWNLDWPIHKNIVLINTGRGTHYTHL